MSTAQKGYYETIKLLLNYCPDINTNLLNAEDNNGFTALMLAARSGHPEIVKLLLERGANDDKGKSAMLLATMRGHLDIVQLLLDHHADINLSDDNGYTTLSLAVECENLDMLTLLYERGAHINTPSSVRDSDDGWTALFFAIETGNLDIIRFLLERSAKVNVAPGNYENHRGLTPPAAGGNKRLCGYRYSVAEVRCQG